MQRLETAVSESTRYSVVIPVYRNRDSLPELLDQMKRLNESLGGRLQVVFVVDGSPDESFDWLRSQLPGQSFDWLLLCLSRNF